MYTSEPSGICTQVGTSYSRPDQTLKPAEIVLTVNYGLHCHDLMMYTTLGCVVILAVLTIVLLVRRQFPGLRAPNLPPGMSNIINGKDARLTIFIGPPCLPIIGNLHQMPKTGAHLKYIHSYPLYIHCSKITISAQVHRMGIHLWSYFLIENGTTNCGSS